nr:putative polyprotein [Tanacetum cinerariifolium]
MRGEEVVVRRLSRDGCKASTADGDGDGGVGCGDDEVVGRDGGDDGDDENATNLPLIPPTPQAPHTISTIKLLILKKGSTASSSSIQNVAFVSSNNTNSTNEVSTVYGVFTSSGHNSQKEGSSSYTNDLIYSFFANQSSVDWTGHAEDDTENYALMAFNSSNSGSDAEVTSCSKVCEESYAKLKKLYDEQREQLGVLSYENEVLESVFDSRSSDVKDCLVNDRFVKVEGMHAVPRPMTGIYMPPKSNFGIDESNFTYGPKQSKTSESNAKTNDLASCESNSSVETLESVPKPVESKPKAVSKPKVWSDAPIIEEYESDSDNEYVFKASTLKGKGIVDSGCSRHMIGNKAYLVEYQDCNGGPVAFGGSKDQITGKGPAWLFDLDYLTDSMNYQPVTAENKANKAAEAKNVYKKLNGDSGSKTNEEQVDQEDQAFLEELERLQSQEKEADDAAETLRKTFAKSTEDLLLQAGAARANSTNNVNTASTPVNTASLLRNIPSLEDIYEVLNNGIFTSASYDDEGVVDDFIKLESTVNDSAIPQSRIHFIHPITHILGDPTLAVQTKSKVNKSSGAHAFVIRTKWVYRNKKDERGVVVRNKARLVAQGHRQKEGIDYDEVFAHVARIEAIRIFLAFAFYMGFIVYQIDVKSAFLYGKIDEERLIDKTLFIKKDKKDIMMVLVYVDDIIFGSTKNSWCDEIEALMKRRFQMSYISELTFFLGLQVKQKEDGISISQDKYVAEILKKFDFMSVKTASTPIETKNPLVKDGKVVDVDEHLYRSMIGSLLYLIASRPDIMYAVCACSRFQVTPKTSHLHAVKRIFRQKVSTVRLKLNTARYGFSKNEKFRSMYPNRGGKTGTNITEGQNLILPGKNLYNMVAYLDKTKGNAQFHRIVDFLSCIHPFRYGFSKNEKFRSMYPNRGGKTGTNITEGANYVVNEWS